MTNKVPNIRFKGFTDDWEQRKFEKFAQRQSNTMISNPDNPCIEYEDVISEQGILNKDVCLKDAEKNGIIFTEEDILYGKLRPYLHNWLNPDFKGVAVGDWWVLRPINMDKNFLYWLIQTPQYDNAANQSSGTKMPRADWKLVSNTDFYVPISNEEQAKIAGLFEKINTLITLHQRKCEQTKELKKFMLQKMFPKKGEKNPEIRFPGFTDDWEQRKLGELVTFSKGSGYSKGDLLEEGTPIILYGRLYTKYETVISNVDTFVEPKEKSVFSKGGEVIVPGSGETAEDISIASVVEESGVLLGGDLNIITPPKEINSAFLAISISNGKPHKDMAKMAQGKSVVHLHNSDLAKIDFPFPIYEEQCRISNQFAELDNLITLHQRKCEQLKELKKFMLQNMFPKKG